MALPIKSGIAPVGRVKAAKETYGMGEREGVRDAPNGDGDGRRQAPSLATEKEQLADALQALTEVRDRYVDIYDFAPLTLITLDRFGAVREINVAGTALLATTRDQALGRMLALWIAPRER